jgi:hypothetical protein
MGLNFATLPHPGSFYSFPSNNTFGASGGGLPTTTACTFQNLRVFVPGTVNAGGNVVMVWRDDTAGTDSSITVTAAAGSASQWYSDLTHTLTATLNHQYNLKLTNNSTADLSGNWSWAIQCN